MAQRFSLAAPPTSGKLSRKEKVTRTGRASSIDGYSGSNGSDFNISPTSAQQLAQQSQQVRQPAIPEDDNPFHSPAASNEDLFSFFDPLAAPVSAPRAAAPAPAPAAKAARPAAAAAAVDPFSASFDSQLSFGGGGAADPFDPFSSAVFPAAVAPAQGSSSSAHASPAGKQMKGQSMPPPASAAKPKARAAKQESSDEEDSSDDDSSDDDSDSSDSSSDDEEATRRKTAREAKTVKQMSVAANKSASSRSAAGAAATGNRSIVAGGGAGAQAGAAVGTAAATSSSGVPSTPTSSLTVDVLELMHKGCPFLKYGKSGYPHFRQFQLSPDNSMIQWFSGNKKPTDTQIPLDRIDEIRLGQTTPIFARHPAPDLAKSSFSVLYNMGRSSLDVIAKDPNDFLIWTRGLRELIRIAAEGRPGQLESLKTLPISLGIHTARRSSVDIRDMNTGQTAAALAGDAEDQHTRARAISTGNKGMYKEVSEHFATLKHKLNKRREEMKDHHYYMSPQYESMQQIIKRVTESVHKCNELFQDGAYPECDDEIWRAGVDLETLKNIMKAVKKPAY